MRRIGLVLMTVVVAGALLAACGDDGDDGGGSGGTSFGSPASSTDADRVVEVVMLDELRFEPAVADGETVTFKVSNEGALTHDFTIGDAKTQDDHDAEMAEMAGMDMGDDGDANVLTIEAGGEAEITWQFTDAGESITFACHIPGHFSAGMVGSFNFG